MLSRLLNWLIQPKRIPLLFSVTVVAGILYHYAPLWTPVWILLSIVIQAGLFRLFDYMKQHMFIGSAAYLLCGLLFLGAVRILTDLGYNTVAFGPSGSGTRIQFWVWFFTPQSIMNDSYPGYVLALFLLFTFFIASIAYYFTFVRYRVLMSFVVMVFPFAIYAKENETMPVLSIIILLFCYFAVMVYCRQAHAEDSDVVQPYQPDTVSKLTAPGKKSPYSNVRPELLDKRFLPAAGMFLAASSILILVLPKPDIKADRTTFDTMVNLSRLSSYLENAISGFADVSDGGNYSARTYPRTLYYCKADEPLNLRIRTFTNYNYGFDRWEASPTDGKPDTSIYRYYEISKSLQTMTNDQLPSDLVSLVRTAAEKHPDFAEKWHLEELLETPEESAEDYQHNLMITAAGPSDVIVMPAPLHTTDAWASMIRMLYQNENGIVFCGDNETVPMMYMESRYFSDSFANTEEAQALMRVSSSDTWGEFIDELYMMDDLDFSQCYDARHNYLSTDVYLEANAEDITDEIRALAAQITEGKTSDYDKAAAIRDYLRSEYTYSLDAPRPANVEAFLFRDKAGVCYQFATAMVQLCRAAGLPARYVEGYMMSQYSPGSVPGYNTASAWDYNYLITTNQAHAFCDVYIAGYGWMMMDATALSDGDATNAVSGVLVTLQYAGLLLFAAGLLAILLLAWLIPMIREKLFRRKYRKLRNAAAVQAAFQRLRKQWKADPALTARALCDKQSKFLQVDLSELLEGFEETVYADRCAPETADRVYRIYCAAYDAFKPAMKRLRKEKRAAAAAEKQQKKHPAGAGNI